MSVVRAVVVNTETPGHLALQEVDSPTAAKSEALVRVAAISLNRGEVRRAQGGQHRLAAGLGPGGNG